jgi:hypothetical protein
LFGSESGAGNGKGKSTTLDGEKPQLEQANIKGLERKSYNTDITGADPGRAIDDKTAISPLSLPVSLLNHDLNAVKLELSSASPNDQATTDKLGEGNGNGEWGCKNGVGAEMYG